MILSKSPSEMRPKFTVENDLLGSRFFRLQSHEKVVFVVPDTGQPSWVGCLFVFKGLFVVGQGKH